jgi:lipoprotein-anchoring transpeptidase ErfK/SrfK
MARRCATASASGAKVHLGRGRKSIENGSLARLAPAERKEMINRQPYLPRFMAGGPGNPLGARALYLGNTVYRIHGTNKPSTIGTFVSSGCIRLPNRDIMDLSTPMSMSARVLWCWRAGRPPRRRWRVWQ